MTTVIEFLRINEILGSENTKWWVEFEDGRELDLVEMIRDYSKSVIDEYERKLNEYDGSVTYSHISNELKSEL